MINMKENARETGRWALRFVIAGLVIASVLWVTKNLNNQAQEARSHISNEAHKVVGQPYIHMGDHTPVTELHQGDVFFVWNNYVKPMTCSVIVTNLFVDKADHIVFHYSMFANWFNEGTYEYNEYFEVPPHLPPGHYELIKKSVSTCNGEETYTTNFDIPVTILPKIVK